VDFYCDALRLVIEIDGEVHLKTREADLERDAILSGKGLKILRVSNEDVLERLAGVMERVFEGTPPPAPPQKGRGENQ
jgi:very-short-patch-repair endonuclease